MWIDQIDVIPKKNRVVKRAIRLFNAIADSPIITFKPFREIKLIPTNRSTVFRITFSVIQFTAHINLSVYVFLFSFRQLIAYRSLFCSQQDVLISILLNEL